MYCKNCGAKLEDGQVYCKNCGAKLEDGRPEAPQAAVQAQQPAAPKRGLSQEQKDEMKRSVSNAGESAKATGKALWSSAKVVGGAALDQAKTLAGSAQGAMSGSPAMKGPALYRKIMMAFGALHVFLFFTLSYAKLGSRNDTVRYIEQMLKIDLPKRLTGPGFLRILKASIRWGGSDAEQAYVMAIVMLALPVLFGVLIIVLNCLGKRKGMIGSVVLSVLTLLSYGLIKILMIAETDALREFGYKMGFGFGFVVIAALVIVQTVVAVKGHAACKKAQTTV